MGAFCSKQKNPKNEQIDKFLRSEKKKFDSEIKLLLLGAGESGKSTIAKQMKVIHLHGFPEEERLSYRAIIYNNLVTSIKSLVVASKNFGYQVSENNQKSAERISEIDIATVSEISEQLKNDIIACWADPAIKQTFERQSEFQLSDCAAYYLDSTERISSPNYIPTEDDVIRSRAKTTGIIETEFQVEQTKFRLVDVGGQRSERKKWMHCFQDVTAVLFVVALSEYDLKLYEDDEINRMQESLKLFNETCNNKWLIETSMILFLNKSDIFAEKIKHVDLNVCFPEYQGGKDYEKALQYIKERFLEQNQNPKKQVYVHPTCATDKNNITVVFNAVKDIVLNKIVSNSGLGVV